MTHAIARAIAPQCNGHPLACCLQGEHMSAYRLEHIGPGLGTLGSEIAPGTRSNIDGTRVGHGERR